MNMTKLVLTYITLMIFLLTGCGGGNDAQVGNPTGNDTVANPSSTCPSGTFYATNGLKDLISVSTDGTFQMERNFGAATGSVVCSGTSFTLTIDSSYGNCSVASGCAADKNQEYYAVMEPGVYTCKYSTTSTHLTISCNGPLNQMSGNVFNPARTYFLQ